MRLTHFFQGLGFVSYGWKRLMWFVCAWIADLNILTTPQIIARPSWR